MEPNIPPLPLSLSLSLVTLCQYQVEPVVNVLTNERLLKQDIVIFELFVSFPKFSLDFPYIIFLNNMNSFHKFCIFF